MLSIKKGGVHFYCILSACLLPLSLLDVILAFFCIIRNDNSIFPIYYPIFISHHKESRKKNIVVYCIFVL